ncbi:MAG: T9SS type A sorting domain-containing protein [Bacteroidetes bacterium]|nr:T9SS type A sorting domain-containing protein [Bacteroidota bacterium]
MKNILTILLLFITVAAFSQRSCDMEGKMVSPSNGQLIKAQQVFNLHYEFKNLGPDNLHTGDTIFWYLSINNVLVNGTLMGSVLNKDIMKDSSIVFKYPNFALNFGQEVSNANFCAGFIIQKRIAGLKEVSDPNTSNNNGCTTVNMSADAKTIGNINALATNVNASPNPAKEYVEISYELINPNTVSLSLYDLNGKVVISTENDKQTAGSNSIKLNTSELQSGLYFYELKVGNESKRFKVLIN